VYAAAGWTALVPYIHRFYMAVFIRGMETLAHAVGFELLGWAGLRICLYNSKLL
jgi:hypothetical protein